MDSEIVGICQQKEFQATNNSASLWDPIVSREKYEQVDRRHKIARTLCRKCPLLEPCERMLADAEERGEIIAGIVAARLSDVKSPDRHQHSCVVCGEKMRPRRHVSKGIVKPTSPPRDHVGEGLCDRCYPVFSRSARKKVAA